MIKNMITPFSDTIPKDTVPMFFLMLDYFVVVVVVVVIVVVEVES